MAKVLIGSKKMMLGSVSMSVPSTSVPNATKSSILWKNPTNTLRTGSASSKKARSSKKNAQHVPPPPVQSKAFLLFRTKTMKRLWVRGGPLGWSEVEDRIERTAAISMISRSRKIWRNSSRANRRLLKAPSRIIAKMKRMKYKNWEKKFTSYQPLSITKWLPMFSFFHKF